MASRLTREMAQNLKNKGKRASNPYFLAFFNDSPDSKFSFCTSVSKKEAKTAVSRNKIKRRFREAINSLSPKTDKIFLFFLRKKVETINFEVLKKEVENFFKKCND